MSRIFILYLLSLTLRSLVLAGLVAIAMTASKKVQVRHAVWTLVLCALFLMPIADVLLPAKLVPSSVPRLAAPIQTLAIHVSAPEVHSAQPREGTTPEPRRDWWQVALMVAVGVTVAMTMRLILVLATVARLRRKSKAVSGPACDGLNGARLLESDAITVPLTIGFVKPSVILPLAWRSWDEWKLRAVLLHEYTHVRRRDPAIAAVAALAKSIFWFNPLAWSLERKLSTLAEQASDEACVQVCGNPRRYAETLLEFASVARDGHRWIGGVAMARHKISLRIERILSLRNPGEGVLQRAGWLALSAALLPALYFSAAAQSQQAVTVASSKIEFAPTLRQELAAVPEPGIVLQLAPRP
ncbi:MAG TPA: M56 family metallopeptidase, partial [Terriglobia bacterium]|nr:M56 family metallopeptidase [Terriglobia bacterium]